MTAVLLPVGRRWLHPFPDFREASYVGRQVCAECHPAEHEKWLTSHHHGAMQPAQDATVAASFDQVEAKTPFASARMFRGPDGSFRATISGPALLQAKGAAQLSTQEVVLGYTFGVAPLQQYLVDLADGRKQVFPFAWDVNRKGWFWVPDEADVDDADPVHWQRRGLNWNYMCAECHSTDLQKNFDRRRGTYQTTWSEIDVSCEACHGPGSQHVESARQPAWLGRWRQGTRLVNLKDPDNRVQVDTCGPCHARREIVQPGFRPGDQFLDFYHPTLLDTPAYYPDGQIRDENYEYTSFKLSLMHERGVRCSSCHDPHTAKTKFPGNALCLQCHVAGKYDTPAHHFHGVGQAGSGCVECHMPQTTYMKNHPRRDHAFRIPRPELTIQLGIPNACNRCHADQSPQWSLAAVTKWYGKKTWPPRLDFAELIHAGREGTVASRHKLRRLARDVALPAVLRASAAALLGRNADAEDVTLLAKLLDDADPLVRVKAVRSLSELQAVGRQPGRSPRNLDELTFRALLDALKDPIAGVRLESARALALTPQQDIPADRRAVFEANLRAYRATAEYLADDPTACCNLASLALAEGRLEEARDEFRLALARDEHYHVARLRLAGVENELGNRAAAEQLYRDTVARLDRALERERRRQPSAETPTVLAALQGLAAECNYFLALFLADAKPADGPGPRDEVLRQLRRTIELDPKFHRAFYNLGVAHWQRRELDEAERNLRQACRLRPDDPDGVYQLAVLRAQRGDVKEAIELLRFLVQQRPDHFQGAALLRQLRTQLPPP